jgi:hypothetical protein
MALSFAIPVVVEMFAEGAVFSSEAAVAAATAASTAATAAAAAAIAAKTSVEAAASGDVDAATAAAVEATTAAVNAGSAAVNIGTAAAMESTEGLDSVIWERPQAFGKWVAKEVAKGAVFEAGMKALRANVHAGDLLPAAPEMVMILTHLNVALQSLDKCTDDWLAWMKSHYDSRASYGTVIIDGTTCLKFQIFQQKIGNLGIGLRKSATPLLLAANKNKNLDTMNALKLELSHYTDKMYDLNRYIRDSTSEMMAAGLTDHITDIMAAYAAFNI